ncbi:hypothetical protein [Acidovorax sp. SUPP3334]|uniref:hypothetical protein n=1 Tax=Acidovorax sp. SUPP3334 TaxID=2920881 RepID=UPI0023DE5811|nr:hypothetical protein [Acidovorax sp. SUPP3334]GKT22570.1 hypothetical protein AVHM3334_08865 [Acidovorax sp. SUPP3334]
MKKHAAVVLAALVVAPVWAINKCTGQDGKVTYQEASCPSSATANKELKIQSSGAESRSSSWSFERKNDEMTGKVSCLAMSPISFPKAPSAPRFIPVHMVVAVTPKSELIGLRTSDNSNLFHNDLNGMGVKTDNGPFIPMSVKAGSHVVGFSDSAALIDAVSNSKYLMVRARFWPFEQLYDMAPIPSNGFSSALKQARECAAKG